MKVVKCWKTDRPVCESLMLLYRNGGRWNDHERYL